MHDPGSCFQDTAQDTGPLYVHQGQQRRQLHVCQQRLRPNGVIATSVQKAVSPKGASCSSYVTGVLSCLRLLTRVALHMCPCSYPSIPWTVQCEEVSTTLFQRHCNACSSSGMCLIQATLSVRPVSCTWQAHFISTNMKELHWQQRRQQLPATASATTSNNNSIISNSLSFTTVTCT